MKILFMCADNSKLSQWAEGLARQILSDEAHIASAGRIEDLPLEFMHELDFVITLGEGDVSSSLIAHAKHLHWPFSDSKEGQREKLQAAHTHLRTQIEEFGREYDILRLQSLSPSSEGISHHPPQ